MKYQTILTKRGIERITAKLGKNELMSLHYISVGDGGLDEGAEITPDSDMSALFREKWRGGIIEKYLHPDNDGQIMLEAHIPVDTEDFIITEIGVWDDGEDNNGVPELIAVGNHPKITKSSPDEGHANDIRLIVPLLVGAAGQELIDLTINPSVVYATKEQLDQVTPIVGIASTGMLINLPEDNQKNYSVVVSPINDDRGQDIVSNYFIERNINYFEVLSLDGNHFFFSYAVHFFNSSFEIPKYYTPPSFTPGAQDIWVSPGVVYNNQWATDIVPGKNPWEQSGATHFEYTGTADGDSSFVDMAIPILSPNGFLSFQVRTYEEFLNDIADLYNRDIILRTSCSYKLVRDDHFLESDEFEIRICIHLEQYQGG